MTRLSTVLVLLTASAATLAAQRPVPSHRTATVGPRAARHEVARVNGVSLMSDRLDAAVSALIPMESYHRNIPPDKLASLRRKALDQLVDEELEYQDGTRLGVRVTATELQQGVSAAARAYGGPQGYAAALRRGGATLAEAEREIRRALVIKKTVERVVTSTCQVSRAEAASFFAANPQRFVEPEQLHIYAITIGVEPSSTSQQWAAAKVRAEAVHQQLTAGASFEDLARKYSTDPSKANGGDMGFVHRGSLADTFETIARTLPVGQASDVVETLYGYHIVRVVDVRPPQQKTFEEVGDKLQQELTGTRCTETKTAWTGRLRASAHLAISE